MLHYQGARTEFTRHRIDKSIWFMVYSNRQNLPRCQDTVIG